MGKGGKRNKKGKNSSDTDEASVGKKIFQNGGASAVDNGDCADSDVVQDNSIRDQSINAVSDCREGESRDISVDRCDDQDTQNDETGDNCGEAGDNYGDREDTASVRDRSYAGSVGVSCDEMKNFTSAYSSNEGVAESGKPFNVKGEDHLVGSVVPLETAVQTVDRVVQNAAGTFIQTVEVGVDSLGINAGNLQKFQGLSGFSGLKGRQFSSLDQLLKETRLQSTQFGFFPALRLFFSSKV